MGHVTWGIKSSFMDYVRSLPDHRIQMKGVEVDESGRFRFPPGRTGASVHIVAHDGALDFELVDLEVVSDGDAATLVSHHGASPVVVARLADSIPAENKYGDVALTSEGSALFGGFYNPWTRMAEVIAETS